MKKFLLLFAATALILVSCRETIPKEKTVLSDFTPFYRWHTVLNGKVKSYKVRTYWAKEENGKIIKGDIITRAERDSLSFVSDFNLEINEDGLVTRWDVITYNGEINHYEYDIMDGEIIGGNWYVGEETRNYFKNEWDDSGRLVKVSVYRNGVDTLLSTRDYTYLENGNRDEVYYYNYKGELTGKDKFIWKNPDHVSEYLPYDRQGELIYSMRLEYDENDNIISNTFDYTSGKHSKFEGKDMEFDEMENLISNVWYWNDALFCVQDAIIEYYKE